MRKTSRLSTFAGRTGMVQDLGNNINYVTGLTGPSSLASYAPDGSLTGFVSGGTITNSFSFNQRLQPVNMSATSPSGTIFSLNYDFHLGAGNNGNVWGITNNKDTSRSQTFGYDPLNRLSWAQNAGTDCTKTTVNGKTEYWGNSYGYDAWGNLLAKTITKCGAESRNLTAAPPLQNQNSSQDAPADPKRPGTLGKPDHQATAKEEAKKLDGKTEVTIPTPKGNKGSRRADAAQVDENGNYKAGGKIVQVIRPTKGGNVPKREQDAAQDLENATGVKPALVPVRPLPKNTTGQD